MIRLVLECYAPGDEANQWCWPNCACDDAYLSGEIKTILSYVDANREARAAAMQQACRIFYARPAMQVPLQAAAHLLPLSACVLLCLADLQTPKCKCC